MTEEVVLFHVLAATAGAAFGLLAVWAGLGRRHWCLRFAPVAAVIVSFFPVPAFDLALVFLAEALVVVVPLLLARRFTATANGIATERSPASPPWRRFSLADLFRGTLLIAAACGVVAYLPGEVRESWWNYVLLGAGFGVATLAGTWAALAHRAWWIRLGVVTIAALLAGIPTALDETTFMFLRESSWPWCAVTASVALLVATWLGLARYAGLTVRRHAKGGLIRQATPSRLVCGYRRGVAISGLALVSVAILLLPAVVLYDLLHPAQVAMSSLPEPNASDDLLRIAGALQDAGAADDSQAAQTDADASAVARRRELFDEFHAALRRPGAVPPRARIDDDFMAEIQSLRQLSRQLLAEGDRHRLAGNPADAQRTYLDLVELGPASSRGGLLIHRLLGAAFEGMGVEGLHRLRGALAPDQRRALIMALLATEAGWDPPADVIARELAWCEREIGWPARLSFVNLTPIESTHLVDHRRSEMLRLLICELALAEYAADHGGPPEDLAGLVPQYLPDVPVDPFTGRPLVYRREPTGYVLYSVGENGTDDGGRRGRSSTNDDLFLDPDSSPTVDNGSAP